jgi:hypothetical protein
MESTYTDNGGILNMILEARGLSNDILLAHFGRTIRNWKCRVERAMFFKDFKMLVEGWNEI